MTDQAERYDRIADGYERWWAPHIAPGAHRLLDRLAGLVGPGAEGRWLDIGTGTGTLALDALRRWPALSIVGVDASEEMAAAAARAADRHLAPDRRARFTTVVAMADRMPFDDGAFDVALSSFVLQLVPDRHRALREARRVLAPGGRIGFVTWLRDQQPWEPDRIFDELLDEVGVGAREPEPRPVDLVSPNAARAALRRAGFGSIEAERDELWIAFGIEEYIGFLTEFDEESLFESFDPSERTRVIDGLRERLAGLEPSEMILRAPIVYATGQRAGR